LEPELVDVNQLVKICVVKGIGKGTGLGIHVPAPGAFHLQERFRTRHPPHFFKIQVKKKISTTTVTMYPPPGEDPKVVVVVGTHLQACIFQIRTSSLPISQQAETGLSSLGILKVFFLRWGIVLDRRMGPSRLKEHSQKCGKERQ
jgi:hypothetical protein